jgi:hypothetical protein
MKYKINTLDNPIKTIISTPRNLDLYHLKNISFSGYSLYYPNVLLQTENDNLILPYNEMFMSFNKKTIYEENNLIYDKSIIPQSSIKNINNIPTYFFIYNTDNYYHFIYDSLPYLYFYFKLKQSIPNLQLLIQYPTENKHFLYTFVKETLSLLNINNIILVDDKTIYTDIYISSSLTHQDKSNDPPNKEVWEVYNLLISNALQKSNLYPILNKKMYISRRTYLHNNFSNIGTNYTQRRVCQEENQLVEYCVEDGYKEVFPENWSMTEKIIYFHNATHVVGMIGGGMCNLLFSPKTVKSYIIVSPTFLDINYRFKYSMDHTNTSYLTDTWISTFKNSNLAPYIRIKINNGEHMDKYGELVSYNYETKKYNILLGSTTSVSISDKSLEIDLIRSDFNPIDKGLNSPFHINLNLFKEIIKK